jgi:hypothetical protein
MATMSDISMPLDPVWLAHRFQPEGDAFHFVSAGRDARSKVAFLTDELLGDTLKRRVLSRAEARTSAAAKTAPLHFIFHSAYCCSTLMARAFDIVGVASSAKEPQLLNDLVGWRHQGTAADSVTATLDLSLSLLTRPFEPSEAVVIKPSNVVNGLLPAMMTQRPGARALLLYAPLSSYLASIARKGMWGRLWARELLSRQLVDGLAAPFGFSTRDHILHTDLQSAAVSWLAQHKLFAETAKHWPHRVRTLDSEVLVARPAESLARIADLFGLTLTPDMIDGIVAAEFSRNAKDGATFAPGQRDADREMSMALHQDEVDKVTIWAGAVAQSIGLEMDLPAALFG